MAKVKCEVYDKKKNYISKHDVVIRKIDYIHALLLMNGKLKFSKRISLFFSYLFKLDADLVFSDEGIYVSRDFKKTYDGIKREMSEIYGAATTIIVALRQFSQKHVFPFDLSLKGLRPDFIGEDSLGNKSLFESKGSINRVRSNDINKSIKQINNILTSKKHGSFSAGYSVISDFNLDSSRPISVRVFDPRSVESSEFRIDFENEIRLYQKCICTIIGSAMGLESIQSSNKNVYVCRIISLNDEQNLILGLEKQLFYKYCKEPDGHFVNEPDLPNNNAQEEDTFNDGLYLKIIQKI